ncbi:conjugative transfer signal peptidase TraF [Stenotrophomonas sp. C3(2023)]|uniref:conjugative transfer signal peptidase TraF n=1 Tax=Stenotrophomonas sp. C3(2023) TaxID=3080277 RepID=UPI00293F546F|nr:conjugative transfer signal peptidase TraF [Stenotrophomonas sp. C3(2023)]
MSVLLRRARFSRGGAWAVGLALLPLLALCALWVSGFHINMTASLPYGLYREVDVPVQRGVLVLACLPQGPHAELARQRHYLSPGHCPARLAPLIKPVVAVAGDQVVFADAAVEVNGVALTNSAALPRDPSGHPMPRPQPRQQRLADGQLLLVSSYNPGSFDGRYFGVLDADAVHAVVEPVLTWHRRGMR